MNRSERNYYLNKRSDNELDLERQEKVSVENRNRMWLPIVVVYRFMNINR